MSSGFWTKRRAAVEAEADTDLAVARATEVEAATAEKTDEEILEELGLPDPDTLEAGDDVSVFMKDVVPARLKTRALRRFWRLNPVLANLDGLVDYGEDYTDAAMVVENMKTGYQVGKGMLAHIQEMARQESEKAQEGDDVVSGIEDDIAEEPEVESDADVSGPEAVPMIYLASETTPEAEIPLHPPRHRMKFHFEDRQTG